MPEGRGQMTENRGQMTENRGQRAKGGHLKFFLTLLSYRFFILNNKKIIRLAIPNTKFKIPNRLALRHFFDRNPPLPVLVL
jgi:hypothetical protein